MANEAKAGNEKTIIVVDPRVLLEETRLKAQADEAYYSNRVLELAQARFQLAGQLAAMRPEMDAIRKRLDELTPDPAEPIAGDGAAAPAPDAGEG